jgi:integrase
MNTDLSILRVVMSTAKIELGLSVNPMEGIAPFDTSQHPTYTYEQPNSLTVDELREFLRCMRKDYPAHYAMTFMGFALGKRPSTMRPLRRKGATVDVLWDTGVLLFRRSNTHGQIAMEGVKTGGEERVQIPETLLAVLRWHVETQLRSAAQRQSDLLFPALHGGFRAGSVLDEPFREVAKTMKLSKRITPRGMRRTFQDLCRAAEVGDLVTRSISGHATEAMQRHYSTVALEEQRRGLANVLNLIGVSQPRDSEWAGEGAGSSCEGAGSGSSARKGERKLSI